MANQPTKYKKFVATAATATLVASAIVPVASAASFTDVPADNEYKVFIDKAVELGLFNDGEKFNPTQSVKRSQVVLVMGRLLEKSGVTADADYATKKAFSDVASDELLKYGNIVKKAGVFTGYADGTLNPNGNISRENMAVVFDRAAKAITGTSLVDAAATIEDKKVADLATANASYQAAIQALRDLEISTSENFGPKGDVQRRHFAKFAVTAIEAIEKLAAKEVKIDSAKVVDAKTIEVKFNAAVADTSKATVELLRGTSKHATTVKWAEDKKSVQLVNAVNFPAADYTVNISGLSQDKLTTTVKVEAQKVASIEILDDVAVISETNADGSAKSATVGYVVKDQYGSDISKTTTLKTNSDADVVASNGVVTLKSLTGKKVGDLIPVILIHEGTATTVSKTVKLSDAATVASVSVKGLLNAKGEAVSLTDATNLVKEPAYIVLDLKDQYGKAFKDASKANGSLLISASGTSLGLANPIVVTKVAINKVDELVIPIASIASAGNTDLLIISKTSGQNTKYSVSVAETATSDAITVGQPADAYAGEEMLIPLTVTDKDGNVITDLDVLTNADVYNGNTLVKKGKGIKIGNAFVTKSDLVVKDGQVYYKTTPQAKGGTSYTFTTSNSKMGYVFVDVKATAVPNKIIGLKEALLLSVAKGAVTLDSSYLTIEDQYGREYKTATPIQVSLIGEETDGAVTANGNTLTPKKKGSATLKIKLTTEQKDVDSSVQVPVQVTDGTEFTGYEIGELGLTKAGEPKDFVVYGLLNGAKVALAASEYTYVVTGGEQNATNGSVTIANDQIIVPVEALNDESATVKNVDTEFTVKVTINNTGSVAQSKFTASKAEKKVQDFFFTSAEYTAYKDAKAITDAVVTAGTGATVANLKTAETNGKSVAVATVDQYGNKAVSALATPVVTIVPEKVGTVTVEGNGTTGAKVTALATDVTEAFVTYKVTLGNATKDIKVKVVAPSAQ